MALRMKFGNLTRNERYRRILEATDAVDDPYATFSSDGFTVSDVTIEYVGNVSSRVNLRWNTGSSPELTSQDLANGTVSPATISLDPVFVFHDGVALNDWSIRRVVELDDSDAMSNNPAGSGPGTLGVWFDATTAREWRLNRPASGTVSNTSIYELADTADTDTVKARCKVTLSYTRT